MSTPIQKVCLVGANGSLGSVILDALVAEGTFSVSVMLRANSTSTPAHAAVLTRIPIDPNFDGPELARLLVGQDAVVAAFPLKDVNQHLRLAEAAYKAGPAGPAPPAALPRQGRRAGAVRAACGRRRGRRRALYLDLDCLGPLLRLGPAQHYLHLDVAAKKALILDAGVTKASMSTLPRVAAAVVRVLQRQDETRNRFVFVQSFCPTPLEVVAALERATGEPWHTAHVDSNAYLDRQAKALEAGDEHALHNIVFVLGAVDADWTRRDEFAMDLLGLEDENLDAVVGNTLNEMRAKGLA
ncbi:hypothetical protein BBAD15_g5231 [Beauveria bassiana D1-5]|uniref:NmrA-like domain-containing protein n=1 Tax=Beauveria bassiana D1-5 TaxID=1245745 RepID=A0A0A2VST2_BEABA|nr:hypothetical protein BBAD15_g5231 [Beauveria bassiana D1-5]